MDGAGCLLRVLRGTLMGDKHTPPTEWRGVPVEVIGNPILVNGEEWVTLMPGEGDDRLWEFSLTTGRTVQVQ